uniref:Uncharacterized protein n=1 Tax=Triticum urartu TaxID=4572 RepID=A0A8R7QAX7_TRIUA
MRSIRRRTSWARTLLAACLVCKRMLPSPSVINSWGSLFCAKCRLRWFLVQSAATGWVKKHSTRVYQGRRRHRHGRLECIARSLQEVQQRGPSDHGGTSAAGPPRAASPPPSACPACASFLPGVDRSHGERPEEQGRSAPASSHARPHVMGITSDVRDFASTGDKDS